MSRYKRQGWFGESYRHSLAARGYLAPKKNRSVKYLSAFGDAFAGTLQAAQKSKQDSRARLLSPAVIEEQEGFKRSYAQSADTPLSADEMDDLKWKIADAKDKSVQQAKVWRLWTPMLGARFYQDLVRRFKEKQSHLENLHAHVPDSDEARSVLQQDIQGIGNELDEMASDMEAHRKVIEKAARAGHAELLEPHEKARLREQVETMDPEVSGYVRRAKTEEQKRKARMRRRPI